MDKYCTSPKVIKKLEEIMACIYIKIKCNDTSKGGMGNDKEMITGKQSDTTIRHLENNDGTKITERVDMANTLVEKNQ